jgi:AcrR family transcriptional regulator
MKRKTASVPRGRPRAFDADLALERALEVFWHKGYEGTSLADLTRAMRINRPSLYSAFGNKAALFRAALDLYTSRRAEYVREALQQPTARAVVQRLLNGAIDLLTDPANPRGCLLVQGALACGQAAQSVRRELTARRAATEAAVRRRFVRAIADRDLPPDSSAADLARYVSTIIHGMAVQSAGGASRAQLQQVARTALRAWPKQDQDGRPQVRRDS